VSVRLEDYDFHLPERRIAQTGAEPRDSSQLLIVHRHNASRLEHRVFRDIVESLRVGDVMVFNQTRVIPARLTAHKPTGGKLEVLLLREVEHGVWSAYLKPARRAALGSQLEFGEGVTAIVERALEDGARVLHFSEDVKPHLETLGAVPLPPYIADSDAARGRYQTVYARDAGSVAAPTAGLHFTPELLERVRDMGIETHFLTLHVGAGTFKPVTNLEHHVMHSEPFAIPAETARAVNAAKRDGRRVIAVGTTTVRSLESAWMDGRLEAGAGETALFIQPGFQFHVVDAMVTNFHLPKSTLLMLVAAFAGFETMHAAYAAALEGTYRFYSLGDAMFIS
jgi:S-adenosylmethionine:tRNA ribosyltransferase-isomerase